MAKKSAFGCGIRPMRDSSCPWRKWSTPCSTSTRTWRSASWLDPLLTPLDRLCHIVHGPHDEAFHTLWNQLRSEHEQLTRKGYTGEGFLSTGHKLGGGRRIPMQEAHRLARAAAEKRRTLAAGSGQKLGGASLARGQDIRRVIADAAARRATVTRGCASGTERSKRIVEETSKNGFRTKADEEDADEEAIMLAYIDLIEEEEREKYGDKYIRTSKDNPAGSQGGAGTNLISPTLKNPSSPPPMPDSSKPAAIDLTTTSSSPSPPPSSSRSKITTTTTAARGSGSGSGSWTCDICTLINPATYLCCDACGTERPTSSSSSSSSPSLPSALLNNHNAKSTTTTTRQPKKSSIQSLATLSRAPPKPLGWLCHHCGTWMESEWWTCVSCGGMKQSS